MQAETDEARAADLERAAVFQPHFVFLVEQVFHRQEQLEARRQR